MPSHHLETPNYKKVKKQHNSRKRAHTDLPTNDLPRNVDVSKPGPSLKREIFGELSQENKTPVNGDRPAQKGQPSPGRPLQREEAPAESLQDSSAPVEHPGRKGQVHRKGRSQRRDIASQPPEEDSEPPTQQPVKDTPAHQGEVRPERALSKGTMPLIPSSKPKRSKPENMGQCHRTKAPSLPRTRCLLWSRVAGRED